MRLVIIYLSIALSIVLVTAKPNLQNDQNKTVSVTNGSTAKNPCSPSPCGPNSFCRGRANQAICSCLPGYIGTPPFCELECTENSDCSLDLACLSKKCKDPCSDACATNGKCVVLSHNPICSCPEGMTGDPYRECRDIADKPSNLCIPSPCGPNSACRVFNGDTAVCSCLPNFFGSPPECSDKPKCKHDSDCADNLTCINHKCQDPCPGSCGRNAECTVIKHVPTCQCPPKMTGNPSSYCELIPELKACSMDSECPDHEACINQFCKDPCKGICGSGATCYVKNHIVECHCSPGFTGNQFQKCSFIGEKVKNPCSPSPCGVNTTCWPYDKTAVCTCWAGYTGDPFVSCKPRYKPAIGCIRDWDCPDNLACSNRDCRNPCPESCGTKAKCTVNAHRAICDCPEGTTGDPFVECLEIGDDPDHRCSPSPCGPNSHCRVVNGTTVLCSCLPNFIGSPPTCKPECNSNSDCANNEGCVNYRCKDACDGGCGDGAHCVVKDHRPICSCPILTDGDPFKLEQIASCRYEYGTTDCFCLQGYHGDPDEFCKPQRTTDGVNKIM